MKLVAICHFGLEAVAKREIEDLGYDVIEVSDGRLIFEADFEGIVRANIFLRSIERILLLVSEFKAHSFEELFDNTYKISWQDYLPIDAKFDVVKASSIKSKLFSIRDIQAITKKAIASKLGSMYNISVLEESGASFPIRVSIIKDVVRIMIDTSGQSLHKRGYRTRVSKAPLSETLAAAIIMLTPYKSDRLLIDPFCGSATIPIEAALLAKNIAPGIKRKFIAMEWYNLIPKKEWILAREEAYEIINDDNVEIQAYDIDYRILNSARDNAKAAGVIDYIHFQERDFKDFSSRKKYGFVITNPPYGIRLEDDVDVGKIYSIFGNKIREYDTWSFYILSGYEKCQNEIGIKASKNRKIYNGMLKTYLYQYLGKKPNKNARNYSSNK